MSSRLVQLDALRGLAALMVVGYHYTTRFHELFPIPGTPAWNLPWGHYGVDLFFMISGFVIFMTLERTRGIPSFIVARFARLYPAYWAAVAVTTAVLLLAPLQGREVTLPQAVVNLTMVQYWLRVPHVDGVYWTLTLELSFYTIMLALHITGILKRHLWVAWCWPLLVLAAGLAERLHGIAVPGPLVNLLILKFAHLFVLGMVFHRMHAGRPTAPLLGVGLLCLGVDWVVGGWESAAFCAVFAGVFYLVLIRKSGILSRVLSMPPLVGLGAISYTLYLTHQNIGYLLLRAMYARQLPPALAIGIAAAAAILIATAVHLAVEKPARDWIRNGYARWATARSASAGMEAGD